jgi:metal-dependent amidase/aminoacylase/carboxypeptidase family protein
VINRVRDIFNASSLATNTSVTIDEFQDYWDKLPNFPLADTYYKNQMKYMDPAKVPETANWTVTSAEESREKEETLGSTDQGNVSWKVPAIQVCLACTQE